MNEYVVAQFFDSLCTFLVFSVQHQLEEV